MITVPLFSGQKKLIKTSFIFCSSRGGQNSINLKVCTMYQILFHILIDDYAKDEEPEGV